jgi:hypothetical protein
LVYRGSRDGFDASDFHSKCDGCSPTVTLIETTKGYIFGGFTPIAWDSSGSVKADSSEKSFLFTVKNPRGNEIRQFRLTNPSRAIRCHSSYGPVFGSNWDICVYGGCNANAENYTNLGGAYANDTELDSRQVFTGEYNFTVKEIEVFAINS